MWSSRPLHTLKSRPWVVGLLVSATLLAGCTVEPLNTAPSSGLNQNLSQTVRTELASIRVDEVKTRYAQQVRNHLLFALNGGQLQPGGKYRIKLIVENKSIDQFVETNSRFTTSSQIVLEGKYALIETQSATNEEKTVSQGFRQGVASYELTSQNFANRRAKRDAENRAAKQLARQIQLAVAQNIADQ